MGHEAGSHHEDPKFTTHQRDKETYNVYEDMYTEIKASLFVYWCLLLAIPMSGWAADSAQGIWAGGPVFNLRGGG